MSERLINANQQTPVRPTQEITVQTYDRLDVFLNSSMDGCPNLGAEIVAGGPVLRQERIIPSPEAILKQAQ